MPKIVHNLSWAYFHNGIYHKKNVVKYKKFDSHYFIIKNEKDINPSYDDNHKPNDGCLINDNTNATYVAKIVSIFDKVKK